MLFVVRPSADAGRPAVVAVPARAPAAGQGKGIQVEQLAPPPAPPPAPAPPRKAGPRAIKVARSPGPASATTERPAVDDDAAVEAAFGITGDKAEKTDDRKADDRPEDEPQPKRKVRVLAAPPATETQAEDKESP